MKKIFNDLSRRFQFLFPESLVEAGFLFALLFGVIGPIPRYLGFLIALMGSVSRKSELASFFKSLPLFVKISLSFLLIWGAMITAFKADSFFSWGKGWSLVIEFAFWVLLAAFVLRSSRAFERWRYFMALLVCVMGGLTLWSLIIKGNMNGLFSVHTFSAMITIPLFSLTMLSAFDEEGYWRGNVLHLVAPFFLIVLFFIGLSSGALVSNMVAIIVLLALFRPSRKKLALFFTTLVLAAACLSVVLLLSGHWPSVKERIQGEIAQLTALDDPDVLTSKRSQIWEAAFFCARRHPAGIGWDQFEKTVKYYIGEKQLVQERCFSSIHNEYLTLLVEGGIPSLGAYLLFLWGCFSILHSLTRRKERLKSALLGSAFAGIMVFALVATIFDERRILAIYFWTIFGAILSQHESVKKPGREVLL